LQKTWIRMWVLVFWVVLLWWVFDLREFWSFFFALAINSFWSLEFSSVCSKVSSSSIHSSYLNFVLTSLSTRQNALSDRKIHSILLLDIFRRKKRENLILPFIPTTVMNVILIFLRLSEDIVNCFNFQHLNIEMEHVSEKKEHYTGFRRKKSGWVWYEKNCFTTFASYSKEEL
jgi:hypothetical protein